MIEISNLTKRYGPFTAVDDVSFVAQPGRVLGFLGPNGAGKSTTMRMLTGLTPATSGTATISGQTYRQLENPGSQVGVMLDASAQHPGRTGREILTLAGLNIGAPSKRVDEMLELVGLSPQESKRRVRNYSLGMRQRLGLASALMGSPKVLILDEPANGLDPQGIHWMRSLLRQFADGGGTVLLSSHLLSEVQLIADDLVMIGRGKIVADGKLSDLLERQGTSFGSADDTRLAEHLAARGINVSRDHGVLVAQADSSVIGQAALEAGVPLTHLVSGGHNGLEEMFLRLTQGDARGSSDAA